MVFSDFVMKALGDQTVGQENAVAALTRAVTLTMAGLRRPSGVASVLLFIGPPSSGKTHMARVLSRVLTGTEQAITCISYEPVDRDNSANSQASRLAQRTAFPVPGRSFNVVVLESIDKSPPSFRDDLALAIDRGELWIAGRGVSLMNSFVILMSELSRKKADQLAGRTIGFFLDGETEADRWRRQSVALEEVDARLGTRLVSRIDEIVIFDRLNEQDIVTLLDRQISAIESYLARSCIGLMIGQEAKTFLLRAGLEDLNHGARQITRVVRNYLEYPLADLMLSRRLLPGTTARVGYVQPRGFLHFEIMMPSLSTGYPSRVQAAGA